MGLFLHSVGQPLYACIVYSFAKCLLLFVSIQNFIVPHIDTVFGLQTPFAAVQLHFTINGGVVAPSNRLCWHLTVIGCTLSEGASTTDQFITK